MTPVGTTDAVAQETVDGVHPTPSAADATRWLDADEQRVWRLLVPLLHELPAALDRQLQVDAGIPHTYYLIMAMLSEEPGRELRMTELSQRTATSLSRLSHAVARLEELGWVQRRKCPTDRRGQIATLTDDGWARLVELAPGHVEAVRRCVFDVLDAEQVRALGGIAETLGEGIRRFAEETGCRRDA